ncbi:SalK [Streptococcus pyogenes]|nr:SalK [Streptococcus pyogenes]VGS52968.1 SalK [Streptococcus pyogenes]VGT40856.1 SalK [Streptococcus pyogenes]VGT89134.1 SalK [Streptococcus pyogenes]VGU22253.1 SalK [Streptococcus pyogenes]
MIRIKNITKGKFFGTAIILLQQLIALLILIYHRKNLSLLFSEKVALVMTLIDTAFIWLATILRQKQGDIFKRIISIISLTIWQYLVSVLTRGTPLFLSSGLQIILLYCYTVEITNLILYGHKQFKDKLDKGLLIIIFVSITSLFVNRILFNFLFLMVFTILHLYPLLVIVLYYRSFRQQISVVRRSLILFSLLLLVILGSELYGEMLDVNQAFNNLGWYLFPLIMSVIYYFKTIHDKLSFVTQRWLGDYKARIELLFLLLILCWMVLMKVLVKDFLLFFIIVDASTLFCLVVISCIFYYLENSKQNFDYENRRLNYFMKSEENMRVEFSNYLHDDVLQNIIAIKNLLSLENSNITHGFIVNELNDLVSGIRDEMDTYHPIVPANQTMKENIQSLFDDI